MKHVSDFSTPRLRIVQFCILGIAWWCLHGQASGKDETKHERVVDILKMQPVKDKDGHQAIQIQFNLHPQVPKNAKVEFELQYQALEFDFYHYILKDENRKNLKIEWKPKYRLPVDTYFVRTRMPLVLQDAAVAKEIEKRDKVFPKDSEPWSWNYPDLPIEIGTKEDLEAELKAVKDYFKAQTDKLVESSNAFMDEIESLEKGDKYVKGGKVDTVELGKFVEDWMKKHGEIQQAVAEYEKKELGLFLKHQAAHFELQLLGRMMARRCYNRALVAALDKRKVALADLKLKGSPSFDINYRGSVTPAELQRKLERIFELAGLAESEDAGAGAAADDKDSKKSG
jgi:hypothetical protein